MGNGPGTAPALQDEEFWDALLTSIEARRVVPVLGPELLTYSPGGSEGKPFYQEVADRLNQKYGLEAPAPPYGLYEAVATAIASGKKSSKLYNEVNSILRRLLSEAHNIRHPYRELAAIRDFDVFVTTTPDSILAQALAEARSTPVDEIPYAPKLATTARRDIPETRTSRYTAVFYLFGKAGDGPVYAIHEEDALEFPFMLQSGDGPERVFSEIRSRNLLLIGCSFAQWLSRFFLRLSSPERLSSDTRTKYEYLAGPAANNDRDLLVFLQHFNPNFYSIRMDGREFVQELVRRWRERNPEEAAAPAATAPTQGPGSGTVFISYASEDHGAADRLRGNIEAIGGDTAWFDKRELRPGDQWEPRILGAIQKCSIFLPLISATTERRNEGYFRLEWHEAAQRSLRIQGRKLIFPVVIDPDYSGDMGRYLLIPDRFKQFQYAHAPNGEMTDALRAEITAELRNVRRARSA